VIYKSWLPKVQVRTRAPGKVRTKVRVRTRKSCLPLEFDRAFAARLPLRRGRT
jgi:hypothetical protein